MIAVQTADRQNFWLFYRSIVHKGGARLLTEWMLAEFIKQVDLWRQ